MSLLSLLVLTNGSTVSPVRGPVGHALARDPLEYKGQSAYFIRPRRGE